MQKIVKTGGYCSDGCQWTFCSFYETYDITAPVTEEFCIKTGYGHRCKMFGGVELVQGSLFICNKIYGLSYEGKP